MQIITGKMFREAFAEQWLQDISEQKDVIYAKFSSDQEWTQFIQPKGGFLNRVMNRLPSNMHYRTEYYTIDSLYVGGTDLLNKDGLAYPSEIFVLIEHENKDNVEEEMWKLSYWRAPLKIIIFYDYSDEVKECSLKKQTWLARKITCLTEMLGVINDSFQENYKTEYLFIVGARRKPGGDIYWKWASNKSPQPTDFVSA